MVKRANMTAKSYGKQDYYWILRSVLQGFGLAEIAVAIPCGLGALVRLKRRLKIPYQGRRGTGDSYGISEIARELGVSRQCIHQKVKKCQNPYKQEKMGRPKKKKIEGGGH